MRAIQIALSMPLLALSMLGQDVRYNFAAGEDFSKYKTYAWVQIPGAEPLDQLADSQVKSAIDNELATKGLAKVEAAAADLLIGYQVAIGQEKQITTFDSGWGYGPGWGRGWYGYGGSGISTSTTSTIHVGQLTLDMYAAGDKKLVWRGVASKTLDPKAKPEKREKNLKKGVAKLLKSYPPAKKS